MIGDCGSLVGNFLLWVIIMFRSLVPPVRTLRCVSWGKILLRLVVERMARTGREWVTFRIKIFPLSVVLPLFGAIIILSPLTRQGHIYVCSSVDCTENFKIVGMCHQKIARFCPREIWKVNDGRMLTNYFNRGAELTLLFG